MNARPITAATCPPHLHRSTMDKLPIEVAYYVPPNFVYMREGTDELYLSSADLCYQGAATPQEVLGSVAIMRTAVIDDETDDLVTGFVADLRFIESVNSFDKATTGDPPEEPEKFNAWVSSKRYEIPIASVAFKGLGDREVATTGDSRFARAVLHLVALADALEKEIADKRQNRRPINEPRVQ